MVVHEEGGGGGGLAHLDLWALVVEYGNSNGDIRGGGKGLCLAPVDVLLALVKGSTEVVITEEGSPGEYTVSALLKFHFKINHLKYLLKEEPLIAEARSFDDGVTFSKL